MESTQTTTDILARLEEPFASKDVKWLVAATSRDNRKGRVTPYADPRAYTDRLNEVVTPSGWTREYTVHTVSPITRMKKDKAIQSGKVLVTCVVTIPGIATHSCSGEEWADDENAMTSAEAQAFKRACSRFGLGRYFYNFAEMWVELNDYKQPKQQPKLPLWDLSANEKGQASTAKTGIMDERPSSSNGTGSIPKGPLDAGVTEKIASCRSDLGPTLYEDILRRVARVRSPRDVANQSCSTWSCGRWRSTFALCSASVRSPQNSRRQSSAPFSMISGYRRSIAFRASRSSRNWRTRCTRPRNPPRNRHAIRTGEGRRTASLFNLRCNHAHHPVLDLSSSRPG
jgi:hypothetical protein